MTAAHSILPPSGVAAWKQCPMWVTMNKRYPQDDTPASMEGSAAHWVFAELLAGRPVLEGAQAPNGIFITDEMLDGADLVVEAVSGMRDLHVEERIAIPQIHPECFGTPDIWSFDQATYTLDVFDYKFGHRFVDEYENEQCIAYTSGIIDHLAHLMGKAAGVLDQAIKVRITVIQPRCFYKGSSVRTWVVRASDLRGHINQLAAAASAAMTPWPQAVTNSECCNCPGRHACPALQQAAYSDAEFAVTSPPVELSPTDASLELKMMERSLDRLQSRVEGLREAVTAYIRQGHSVPWHRVKQGFGRQQWSLPVDQVLAMGEIMGVDLSKPGIKTPKQAIKSGVDEAVIKAYSVTPLGSLKLISDNPADARRVFGKTQEQ